MYVCKSCEIAIQSFLTFKKRCLKSYYYWKRYLKALQKASDDKAYGTFCVTTKSFDVHPPDNNDEHDAEVYFDYMDDSYEPEIEDNQEDFTQNETSTNSSNDNQSGFVLNVASLNRKRLLDNSIKENNIKIHSVMSVTDEDSSVDFMGFSPERNISKKMRLDKPENNITILSDVRIENNKVSPFKNVCTNNESSQINKESRNSNESEVNVFSNEDILGKIVDFDEISNWYDQQVKADDKKQNKKQNISVLEETEESSNEVICQICNKSVTNSLEHLQFHVKQSQDGCIVCGKRSKELKKHMRKHMGIFHTFNCKLCDMKYMFNHSLNTHMNNAHVNKKKNAVSETKKQETDRDYDPDEDYKSLYEKDDEEIVKKYILFPENVTYEDKKTWKKLMKNVRPDPIPDFTCQICKEHVKGDLKSMDAHVDSHLVCKSECSQCNYIGSKRFLIYQHMKRMHMIVKDHYCCICETYFKSPTDVTKHFRSVHCKSMMYHCSICQHASNSVHHMKVHVTAHLKESNSCTECNLQINSNAYMKYHLQKSHKYKLCIYCDHVFEEKVYEDHVQLHINVKTCKVCADEVYEYELQEHEQSHYFKCFECQKEFRFQHELDRHFYKTHYNDECCHICNKNLTELQTDQVYFHYVDHLHENNVKCIQCNEIFSSLMKFHKHMIQHKASLGNTNKKKLICRLCKRKFKCKTTLHTHMKTHPQEDFKKVQGSDNSKEDENSDHENNE